MLSMEVDEKASRAYNGSQASSYKVLRLADSNLLGPSDAIWFVLFRGFRREGEKNAV